MPINFGDATLRLNPVSQITLGQTGGGADRSLERERLKLMREQFEEQRRQNQEREALGRLEEAGRTTREKMQADAQAAKLQAEQRAALMQRRQEAIGEFGKRASAGDIEGAEGMVPMLDSLGVAVSREGEEHGLPRYRFDADPEGTAAEAAAATDARMDGADIGANEMDQAGIGYPTDEQGTLDEPRSLTGPQAFSAAMEASRFSGLHGGMPLRAAPEADLQGAVPRGVIDMGAMASETERRLNPALSGLVGAYPDASGPDPGAYRRSADQTAGSVKGLGLPAAKAVERFDALRGGPDSIIRAELAAEAQKAETKEKRTELSETEKQRFFNNGTQLAKSAAGTYDMKAVIERRKTIAQAASVLTNNDDSDDHLAGATISRMMGERGATTEGDVQRVLGSAAMSFLERIKTRAYKEAIGGLSTQQKNALMGVLKEAEEADSRRVNDYLGNLDELIASPDTHPEVARGVRAQRLLVPKDLRDAYEASRGEKTSQAGPDTPLSEQSVADQKLFDETLNSLAKEAGLAADKIRKIIGKESGGRADAENPSGATGLIQFMPEIAKSLGTSTEELKKMSPAEQLPFVIEYFKSRGVTEKHDQGDYYVAVAAPAFLGKPDSTEVYKRGTPEYDQNPSWDVNKDGVVTVGDLKRWGGGKNGADAAAVDAEAEALRILEVGGY